MQSKPKQFFLSIEMILVYIILLFCAAVATVNPTFLGTHTVVMLLRSMLVLLIFAMCELIVIISGGIDVSFPATALVALYATVKIFNAYELDSAILGFAIAGGIGLAVGALNALLISVAKIPPLIATLGVSSVLNGGTLAFLGTNIISNMPECLDVLSQINLYVYTNADGVSYKLNILFLAPVVICLGIYFLLKFTMLGRGIYAIGGDKNAARIAGFNVTRIQFFVYMLSGLLAGLGGLIYTILSRQADPKVLMGQEMMIIAAVVMGGARITGGHGTVIGTVLGVGLIALIQNNLIMLGVPAKFQTLVIGLIIILGVCITSIRAKRVANSAKV